MHAQGGEWGQVEQHEIVSFNVLTMTSARFVVANAIIVRDVFLSIMMSILS